MKKDLLYFSLLIVLFTSCTKSKVEKPVESPPPVIVEPVPDKYSTATITVGDGKSALTIDGNKTRYAEGTILVVKPGTYANGINIQNLTGVTVKGTGVVLDGLSQSKAGHYNVLSLTNLNNVVISEFTTRDNGYRMLYVFGRLVNVTLDKMVFRNSKEGIVIRPEDWAVWDGNDNSVKLLNFQIRNSTFQDCDGIFWPGGSINNGQVLGLIKNFVFAHNTVTGGNPGDIVRSDAVDNFTIHDNIISNVNLKLTNDTRLFMMTGNGVAYNNKFTNNEGHAIGIWPVSFGTSVKTSKIYNNIVIGTTRYSAFEQQEFAKNSIPGKTTKSDLVVEDNTAGNINTDKWTGYPGALIDIYASKMGGQVELINNKGYGWFPKPASGVYHNPNSGGKPTSAQGNTYTDNAP